MKKSKRMLSFVLAIIIICAMALPASAASYTWDTNYNGSSVEVAEECTTIRFTSSLISDSSETLKTTARAYGWKLVVENDTTVIKPADTDIKFAEFSATGTMVVSLSKISTDLITLDYVVFYHYVGGYQVNSNTLAPGYV